MLTYADYESAADAVLHREDIVSFDIPAELSGSFWGPNGRRKVALATQILSFRMLSYDDVC